MFRIKAIFDLLAFGEEMGALRVVFNAMANRELLNRDVDQTMDYLKSVYNRTDNRKEFLFTVLKEQQVNIQIKVGDVVVDSKINRDVDSHLATGYNEMVEYYGVHYWTL